METVALHISYILTVKNFAAIFLLAVMETCLLDNQKALDLNLILWPQDDEAVSNYS